MRKLSAVILSALVLVSAPALAGNGHGRSGEHGYNRSHHEDNDDQGEDRHSRSSGGVDLTIDRNLNVHFNSRDLNVIVDWFDREPTSYRDGRGLPPGLAKQLRERGHLPPGLEAKGLPPGLADRLGPAPRGYERVVIGRDVVLMQVATGIIADILRNVF